MENQKQAIEKQRAERVEQERLHREQQEVERAFMAGCELREIPEKTKINEEAVKAYGAGLDERERQTAYPMSPSWLRKQIDRSNAVCLAGMMLRSACCSHGRRPRPALSG